jgi:hypothetical protein
MNAILANCHSNILATRDRDTIIEQDVPLDAWWGNATPADPTDAYCRIIDACRLAVEET